MFFFYNVNTLERKIKKQGSEREKMTIMLLKHTGLLGVKANEKTFEGTGNVILRQSTS